MNAAAQVTIARLERVTGSGIILFWVAFFTVGLAPRTPPSGYFAFEHAFPLPDGVLAVTLLLASRWLADQAPARQQAGALVFLGLLDVSFNVQNGMYGISPVDTVLALLVNAWCIGAGLLIGARCRFV
jgi:hypothetical protein